MSSVANFLRNRSNVLNIIIESMANVAAEVPYNDQEYRRYHTLMTTVMTSLRGKTFEYMIMSSIHVNANRNFQFLPKTNPMSPIQSNEIVAIEAINHPPRAYSMTSKNKLLKFIRRRKQ